MAGYSASDKFIHRLYLSNYFLSKASLEMEDLVYGARANEWELDQVVFVTGLARSGTTAVMRKLHDSDAYASLQYNNMPFLLAPNLWKRSTNIEMHERAHKDGIIVDGNSPEEFDEYFWKVHLKDSYIGENYLNLHNVEESVFEKYRRYISLVSYSKGRHRYISKNNNNVLRMASIKRIPKSTIIMLFRKPLDHAASLRKLHGQFTEMQKEDPFILEYFNFLGHHEFGLNHKPFNLSGSDPELNPYPIESLDYWLYIWLNYYSYILKFHKNDVYMVSFESITGNPNKVFKKLWNKLQIDDKYLDEENYQPREYNVEKYDKKLVEKCELIYAQLEFLT